MKIIRSVVIGGASPPGVAPSDAPFITFGLDADLTNEYSVKQSDASEFNDEIRWRFNAVGVSQHELIITGDTEPRSVWAEDRLGYGAGSAVFDTELIRAAANRWSTPDMWTFTPSTAQAITAASNSITVNAAVVMIDPDANRTLTSTPTIADGADGQLVWVINVDTAFTVTVQDEGTLAGSNIELGTSASLALSPQSATLFMYSSTLGSWIPAGGGAPSPGGATNALLDGVNHTDTVASAMTRGDLIVGTAAGWDDLAIGASGRFLRSDGTDPSWAVIAVATDIPHDLLSATHTDTVASAFTRGDIIVATATGWDDLAIGASGQFLRSDGTDPSWAVIAVATDIPHALLSATHTDTVASAMTRGDLIVGTAAGWDDLPIGANNTFLKSDGTDAAWATLSLASPGVDEDKVWAIAMGTAL